MNNPLDALLFPGDDAHVFAIIDGASCENLLDLLAEFQPSHVCLYAGEISEDIAEVAPYLVELVEHGDFTKHILGLWMGNNWGIFARTWVEIRPLRKHLRTLLNVRGPQGDRLYFRYYDPRVLGEFLGGCTPTQIERIFGPVQVFLMESNDAKVIYRRTRSSGKWVASSLDLNSMPDARTHRLDQLSKGEWQPSRNSVKELQISFDHLEALSALDRLKFKDRMLLSLAQVYPLIDNTEGQIAAASFIEYGSSKASAYRIVSEGDVCLYIHVMVLLGRAFDEEPNHAWARSLLNSDSPPTHRVTRLYETAVAKSLKKMIGDIPV